MLALLTVLGLVVAACGGSTESPSASVDAGKGDYKACLALDVGGIGDKSFNDSAYEGLLEAEAAGYDTQYSEAKTGADYAANIQLLIDEGCKSLIVVGFSQGEAVVAATKANPDIAFAHVDSTWPDAAIPANFTGLDSQIDERSMLACYLAATISESKVGSLAQTTTRLRLAPLLRCSAAGMPSTSRAAPSPRATTLGETRSSARLLQSSS